MTESLDTSNLRILMRQHLFAIPGITEIWDPGNDVELIQFENRDWSSPDPTTAVFLRETLQINSEAWAATNTRQHNGAYVLDVVVPVGKGTEKQEQWARAILTAFYPGLSLSNAQCTITVHTARRRTARRDTRSTAWYKQAVEIPWVAYTTFIQE